MNKIAIFLLAGVIGGCAVDVAPKSTGGDRADRTIETSYEYGSIANECYSKLVVWSDYDKTLELVKDAYHAKEYQSVEDALSCLSESTSEFPSGKPGSVAVYWFFRGEMHAPGADEEDKLRIEEWRKTVPDSKFAGFADLRFSYSQAWNARGTRFANDTKEDQFKRFKKQLLETETLILSKENTLKDTPISYNLLMAVTLDTNGTQSSAMEVFDYGVAKWPNYYDFYEVFLTRLVPKWGGSWNSVDEFINFWAKSLVQTEENTMYARLYYNVHKHNRIDPRSTLVDWTKLKPSLVNLYTRFPTVEYLTVASSYACLYADPRFYNSVINKTDLSTSEYWLGEMSKEACDSYMNSIPQEPREATQ